MDRACGISWVANVLNPINRLRTLCQNTSTELDLEKTKERKCKYLLRKMMHWLHREESKQLAQQQRRELLIMNIHSYAWKR